MGRHWFTGLILGILALVGAIVLSGQTHYKELAQPSAGPPHTAFVHLFEWLWDDVAQECETVLGPNGFDAVQISPPNEHAVIAQEGFPWWQRYQPVSYKLISRSGDRSQFLAMVRRCHRAGVKVYADAVINHMAAEAQGVGSAGTPYRRYDYPRLYDPDDFHTCRRRITNYNNHDEVTTCELVSLPDLNTGLPRVRDRLATYLADLVQAGVDGFRIDAAKHIKSTDLHAILARLDRRIQTRPYIYQEVIDPGYEAVKKAEYYPNGDVIEFEYGRIISEKFLNAQGQTLSQLEPLGERWGLMPAEKAVVFIDNHDKQRGHAGGGNYLTYKDGTLYDLANIFMLAHPYGYPQVMSSYAFSHGDQGPPADEQGRTRPIYRESTATCAPDWICEHRRTAILGMVEFRNHTAAVPQMTDWWSNGGNQIAFGRGDRGFVVINRESTPLHHPFQTQLPAGTYCNVIRGMRLPDGASCLGGMVTVDDRGILQVEVPAMEAVAIHVGSRLPG